MVVLEDQSLPTTLRRARASVRVQRK